MHSDAMPQLIFFHHVSKNTFDTVIPLASLKLSHICIISLAHYNISCKSHWIKHTQPNSQPWPHHRGNGVLQLDLKFNLGTCESAVCNQASMSSASDDIAIVRNLLSHTTSAYLAPTWTCNVICFIHICTESVPKNIWLATKFDKFGCDLAEP